VLDPVLEELRRFDSAWQSVGHLMNEASIGVLSLGGLAQMLGEQNKAVVDARMQLMRQGRSVARSVLLDAALGETYTRTEVNFGGIPQVLEKAALQIAGAINVPVALLFGQSAAGMNATGENDRAQFDDDIAVYQRRSLRSKLQRLLSWMHGASVEVEFRPIRELTESEEAVLAKTRADTLKVYYDMEVIEPEHIVDLAADELGLDADARKAEIVAGREEGAQDEQGERAVGEEADDDAEGA
jgi:hypothetical protein